jgi:hypothetical protein
MFDNNSSSNINRAEIMDAQGEFMKESHPRKWVLEARHLEAGGFCLVVVGRVLAAIACRMRLVRGGFGPPRIWFGHSPPVRLFASSAAPE